MYYESNIIFNTSCYSALNVPLFFSSFVKVRDTNWSQTKVSNFPQEIIFKSPRNFGQTQETPE